MYALVLFLFSPGVANSTGYIDQSSTMEHFAGNPDAADVVCDNSVKPVTAPIYPGTSEDHTIASTASEDPSVFNLWWFEFEKFTGGNFRVMAPRNSNGMEGTPFSSTSWNWG